MTAEVFFAQLRRSAARGGLGPSLDSLMQEPRAWLGAPPDSTRKKSCFLSVLACLILQCGFQPRRRAIVIFCHVNKRSVFVDARHLFCHQQFQVTTRNEMVTRVNNLGFPAALHLLAHYQRRVTGVTSGSLRSTDSTLAPQFTNKKTCTSFYVGTP